MADFSFARATLIPRYQLAITKIIEHDDYSDHMSLKYGLAYLNEMLADDLAKMFQLQDAFEAVEAELLAELDAVDFIPWRSGYYKIDAMGMPKFYQGVPMEVEAL